MTDLVHLQEDITLRLQSEPLLSRINIVQQRKLRLESQVALDTVWLTPREGRSGCGILVEMPTIQVKSSNLPGPEHFYGISVVILEEPNINFSPDLGTLQDAETVSEIALEALQHLGIENVGSLYASDRAIAPADEFENVVAYRVNLELRRLRTGTARCALPAIAEEAGEIALTAGNENDLIYYTTDGSLPGSSNTAATPYSAPFTVEDSTVVRWAAYRENLLGSDVGRATVNVT